MPVIIPPGYAQVTLNYTGAMFDSGAGATVLGFGGEGEITQDLAGFAQNVEGAWEGNMQAITSDIITLSSIYVLGPTQSVERGVGTVGSVTTDMEPPAVACLVNYKGQARGPRSRGRSFIPGVLRNQDVNSIGDITSARVGEIETAWFGFLDDCTEGTAHVILQRSEGVSAPLDPPPPVFTRAVSARAASQRRRQRS